MRINETVKKFIKILDTAGNAKTGVVTGDLTVFAQHFPKGGSASASWTHAFALTELSLGWYLASFAAPPVACDWRLAVEHASYRCWNGSWEGEVETNDLDSLFSSVVRPAFQLDNGLQLGATGTLDCVAYRKRTLDIPFYDDDGDPLDLSGYTNLRMGVRTLAQTGTKWDAGPTGTPTGFVISVTGTSHNVLHIEIPEDAAFYAELAAGQNSVQLFWEVVGDEGGVSTATVPIIRSSYLNCFRREYGVP
jgi:hypothetical protein